MTTNPNRVPVLTPTRLAFGGSPDLEVRLLDFLNPEARRTLHEKNRRIKLMSRRVRNLDLGVGVDSVGSHTKQFNKYKKRIEEVAANHIFQLKKDVLMDEEVQDGLELSFTLDFATSAEKRLLVDLPFIYPESREPFEVYTALPSKALGAPHSIARAYALLELSMHEPGNDDLPEHSHAPWQMNVRRARVEHIPQLRIVDQPDEQ